LAVQEVFKDAGAGKKASEEVMEKVFETTEIGGIADRIITRGEIHLTAEQRKSMTEEKRKQIISLISRNSINPQTKAPNPPARIEAALTEARVTVDPFKSAKEQVDSAVKAIRPILPIKFETLQMVVKIPATYTGNSYKTLREYGEVKKEEWDKGDLISLMEIPAGLQDEFYSRLNSLTHGEVKIKIMR
ncbi:MAG: ribosome assembly factor SBDS, partial [Candidatus Altiarchaeota archaeon]|nr:ribosome assembly factor SBDS [Candidatus Altiarchaeota archaeon]